MNLSDTQLRRLIDNFSQLAFEAEQILKEGLDSPQTISLFNNYKEIKAFVDKLEFSNQELREKIKTLPELIPPNYLIEKILYLNVGVVGAVNPYLLAIILTISAPVSIPLLVWKKVWTNNQRRKLRVIAQTLNSIIFMLEYPHYFPNQSK